MVCCVSCNSADSNEEDEDDEEEDAVVPEVAETLVRGTEWTNGATAGANKGEESAEEE